MELRDAATVMLVRDGPSGHLEVLLLQRNLRSDFAGGAHVFPGGAVDPGDRDAALALRCAGRTPAECDKRLGLDNDGLAFWVAAVRECFEEAGVLLARHAADEHVLSFLDGAAAARFAAHRAALNAGKPFTEVLAEEDLVLDIGLVHYVSHWVTPEGAPRRYDTRFFLAAAPPEQVPLHDDSETIASTWIGPAEALARHQRGELHLILPTIRNLEAIAPCRTVDECLATARAVQDVPTVRPRMVTDGEGLRILLPGDVGYDDAGVR